MASFLKSVPISDAQKEQGKGFMKKGLKAFGFGSKKDEKKEVTVETKEVKPEAQDPDLKKAEHEADKAIEKKEEKKEDKKEKNNQQKAMDFAMKYGKKKAMKTVGLSGHKAPKHHSGSGEQEEGSGSESDSDDGGDDAGDD